MRLRRCAIAGVSIVGLVAWGLAAPSGADRSPRAVPNPLTLYPRRPGAKYLDIEVAPGQSARVPILGMLGSVDPSLASSLTLKSWRVVQRRETPVGLVPADRAVYEAGSVAEGFAPWISDRGQRVLQVVVGTDNDRVQVACAATAASDGAVALPLDPPERFNPDAINKSMDSALAANATPSPIRPGIDRVYFPIGLRTGRFYIACMPDVGIGQFYSTVRAVWGIDV